MLFVNKCLKKKKKHTDVSGIKHFNPCGYINGIRFGAGSRQAVSHHLSMDYLHVTALLFLTNL